VPPHKTDSPDGAMGEGIAIDAAGNLYTAEATVRGVTKYVRTRETYEGSGICGFQTVLARGRRKEGTTKFIPPTRFMGANLKTWSKNELHVDKLSYLVASRFDWPDDPIASASSCRCTGKQRLRRGATPWWRDSALDPQDQAALLQLRQPLLARRRHLCVLRDFRDDFGCCIAD